MVGAPSRQGNVAVSSEFAPGLAQGRPGDRQNAAHCAGNANKEIAKALSLCEETLKSQVRNIPAKLGAKDRTHAAMIGLKRGIIQF